MFTEICEIHFIVIQISASIDLGYGFKKANTIMFLLPMNFCFAAHLLAKSRFLCLIIVCKQALLRFHSTTL